MDIDIKDYLTPEEIKDVCKDALYQKIRSEISGALKGKRKTVKGLIWNYCTNCGGEDGRR